MYCSSRTFEMQHPNQLYGRSGELGLFGATRYFDGLAGRATGPVTAVMEPEDLKTIQEKLIEQQQQTEVIYRSQLGAKTKSNLADFLGSPVSPEASFHKKPAAASSTTSTSDEPCKVSSSSSPGSTDIITAAASMQGCCHDLGVLMGDRRLQGVRVVRSADSNEERWVVRCGAWEEEERHVHEKIFDAAPGDDHQVKGGELDHCRGWDTDSSSDLFELDLETRDL